MPRKLYIDQGRVDVFPFKKDDFNEMVRMCEVHRDKTNNYNSKFRWYRNYIMLILGVNTGCRIEVLLQLTPKKIAGGESRIKEFKTKKVQHFELNEDVIKEVNKFLETYNIAEKEYIFKRDPDSRLPLTRQQAYNIIQKLKKEVGITYNVGCHSLRKSYGRFNYDINHDIHLVQRMLGHNDPIVTQRYICLEDDQVAEAKKSSCWGL